MTGSTPSAPAVTDSLSLAMVTSSDVPLLLLDGDLQVIAVSKSFCSAFKVDADNAVGRPVFSLGSGEWDSPKFRSLLSATASGLAALDRYEMDLDVKGRSQRHLVIKAQKLEYGVKEVTRILVTAADITEARIAEKTNRELLQDKAVLLQEIQHRVANSLQIITSVLMQSARNVQSEETRQHLNDAHHRVMSIASVQRQLSTSHRKEVELRPYLTQLCNSLGASMIRDHDRQSIEVSSDGSVVEADVSISLGLIVTELVINALKHAFPDGRPGRITVGYQAKGPNWTLSVRDDGVGMGSSDAKPGLGTSIVDALSKQLGGQIDVVDGRPGTSISIAHTSISAVNPTVGRAV